MSADLITVSEADALWIDLRTTLGNFERALRRIVETRAWEPLGYASFSEAWQDRMRGTRLLTAEAQGWAVAAMRAEGMAPTDMVTVLGAGSGVGPERAVLIARQIDNGVPPRFVTTVAPRPRPLSLDPEPTRVAPRADGPTIVREHTRESPSAPRFVHVELTEDEYVHFRAVAEGRGLDLTTEGAKAIRAWFGRLERVDGTF